VIHKQDIFPGLIAAVLFLTVCAYLGAAVSGALGEKTETVKAVSGEYCRSVKLTGIVIREETPLDTAVTAFSRREGAYVLPSCDGYEYLSGADLEDFTWQSAEKLLSSKPEESCPGRAVTDFAWYFAAKCPNTIAVSGSCRLHFEGTDAPVCGRFVSMDTAPTGEVYLLLRFTEDSEEFLSLRFAEAELILSDCSGIEVPKSAVVNDSGESYVFINAAGVARKAAVEIIYNEKNTCLAAFSSGADALHPGDEVVKNAGKIYEGKILS